MGSPDSDAGRSGEGLETTIVTEEDIAHSTRRGLCKDCHYGRIVASAKGSRFILCERSLIDARYEKYPVMPVLECNGYLPADRSTA